VKFPLDIVLPIFPVKLTIGKEKETVDPLSTAASTMVLDGKDAAPLFNVSRAEIAHGRDGSIGAGFDFERDVTPLQNQFCIRIRTPRSLNSF
jgi:hypothetical protein